MKRYLPSSRSHSNVNSLSALGEQFIREFTLQAQAVMEELTTQFADNLQAQAAQVLQDQILPGIVSSGADAIGDAATGDDGTGVGGGIGQLLNTGVRYLVSRPRTSNDSVETARSIDAAQLRISSSQAAAEAQQALSKGSRNL